MKLDLGVEDGEIVCTEFHPFWVVESENAIRMDLVNQDARSENCLFNARWVEASKLKVGDGLMTQSGRRVIVRGVTFGFDCVTVYNLKVECNANYAIGEDGILVHNK
ncbi:MAG: polymorphic toxin-type HINT domain-containing protein [Pirellulaceae bacterium]|nr:polymorphic toxin-type HINT domain-containing protein [Pirellulaceae bacterium]